MEQRRSFGQYQEVSQETLRAARRDWLIWVLTSLGVSLVPFVVTLVIYRAGFETPQHSHDFPSFSMLFGGGELLLVILSVTGATLAEFWLHPNHLRSLRKASALVVSALIAFTAAGLSTIIAYANIIGREDEIDRHFVATLSVVLFILVVVIQSITLLTRHDDDL